MPITLLGKIGLKLAVKVGVVLTAKAIGLVARKVANRGIENGNETVDETTSDPEMTSSIEKMPNDTDTTGSSQSSPEQCTDTSRLDLDYCKSYES